MKKVVCHMFMAALAPGMPKANSERICEWHNIQMHLAL